MTTAKLGNLGISKIGLGIVIGMTPKYLFQTTTELVYPQHVLSERRMRDLNPRDFRLRVFETRALGHYANPPRESYVLNGMFSSQAAEF